MTFMQEQIKDIVKEAQQASDNLGSAFNAETMGAANAVTKSKAKLMKETGVA